MKFLDTNITVENFVSTLRNLSEEGIHKLLLEWDSIDQELQEEYLDQFSWLLNKAAEFIEKTSEQVESAWCKNCGEPRYKCCCESGNKID
jgi:hypothetical protein